MSKIKRSYLKIGDSVIWRGTWGSEPPKKAKVTGIQKTKSSCEKYGTDVDKVLWSTNFVVDLDNGHWAYSIQLKPF